MSQHYQKLNYVLVFVSLLFTQAASAQNFSWVKSGGLQGNAITTDANQNTIVVGEYSGNAQFGVTTLTPYGGYDGYVAKYDQSGNVLWAKGFGGGAYDFASAVATDPAGNVYVCGYFLSSTMRFTANDTLAIGGFIALYLVKYDASGNFQWARKGSVPQNIATSASALRIDGSGNVIMGGSFGATLIFGTDTLTGGSSNLYLAKYSSTGNLLWTKTGVSNSYCQMNSMAVDAAGNIYATGKIGTSVDWGTGVQSVPVGSGDQVYVAKFNSLGVLQWMKQEGKVYSAGTTYRLFDSGNGIAVDGAGNVYVGGSLLDTAYTHPTTFAIIARQRGMVAKYNSAGVQQWLKRIGGGNEHAVVNSLAVDAAGNPYIVGNYKDTMSISGTVLPPALSRDVFIARLTPSGTVSWFKTAGGPAADAGSSIAIDVSGSVVATGSFDSLVATFGTINVTGPGMTNGFVSRLSNTVVNSIDERGETGLITVLPNPANDVLLLNSQSPHDCHLLLSDASGRILRSGRIGPGRTELNISMLAPGRYFVTIHSHEGLSDTHQVIKL